MAGEAGKGDKPRPVTNYEEKSKNHHNTFGSWCLRCKKVKVSEPYTFCNKCIKETQ